MPDNLASTCDSQVYMSYPPSSMTVVELEEACGRYAVSLIGCNVNSA